MSQAVGTTWGLYILLLLLLFVLLFHSNWPLWGQTAGTSVAKEGYGQGCLKANFRAYIIWISKWEG